MKRLSSSFTKHWFITFLMLLIVADSYVHAQLSSSDNQKVEKFRDLEKEYDGFPEMIRLAKASWLTSRGNHYGQQRLLGRAISQFTEAITIKGDFIPAYLSLGIAYREKGMYQEALSILEKAPSKLKIDGSELGGFEFDLYNAITSVYVAMQNKSKALEYAKKTLAVANDPERIEQRQFAEKSGVISTGSDAEIIELLKQLIQELQAK
ncbi:MAG: hypothetical protein ACW963_05045 [Candidatus Sifarchaeia archaeon]|jgi:tetratricopeptide (TPR) repeat protein